MKMWMKTILNVLLVSGASTMFHVPPPQNLPDTLGFAAGTPPGSSVGSLTGLTGSLGSAGPSFGSIQIPGQSPLQPTGSPPGPPSVQDLNPLRQGIYFKDIADGFDGQNFNFGDMQTIPNSNERSCYKTCLDDERCVMVVLCESNEEPVDPIPNSGPPLSGFKMMLPRKESFDCHVFYKVDTTASYSQNEIAQWGNECKYITYNPECRSPQVDSSWKKYQEVSMTSEHTISQKYTCVNGYLRTQDAFNEITCDKYGNIMSTGGCTIDTGAQGLSQALLPALGGNTLNENLAPRPETCSNTPPPCGDNAECQNTDSSYTCTCNTGYKEDASGNCIDKNECTDGSHGCGMNSYCVNNNPGYECFCNTGYAKENGDGDCIDVDECQNGNFTCDVNSICVNSVGSHTCKQCGSGFKVEAEKNECVDIDECNQGGCGENSDCVNTAGSFECTCLEGYNMDNDQCVDIDECQLDKCDVSANCVNNAGSFECTCLEGYKMENDQCVDKDECTDGSHNCSLNSDCVNNSPGFQCDCHSGYENDGDDCVDIDECQLDKCDVSATCVNNAGSFECTCLEGYKMENDQCVDKDECTDGSHNCSLNSDCVNNSPGFQCDCHSGYENDGDDCVDKDECMDGSHNCSLNSDCVNNSPGFQCVCHSGYEKDGDDCVDIDDCQGESPCGDNMVCENNIGGYDCPCQHGFTKHETECVDIDECEDESSCDGNSDCENNMGGFDCHCHNGFAKVGNECVDQDECADSACGDLDLDCHNTPGSFACTCRDGFEKDLFDECMPTACIQPFTYMKEANLCVYSQVGPMYSFYNSIASCENNYENGRLAVLNTHEKMQAVKTYLTIHYNTYYGWYFWVDIFQTDTVDRYPSGTQEVNKWGDGTVASPSVFAKDPYSKLWFCSEISYFSNLYLQESSCSFTNEPVCEIPIKNCPNTFTYDGEIHFCFKLVVQTAMKEDAVTKCQDLGARLAQTNTDQKIMAVRDQMADVSYSGGVFVGGYQKHHAQKEFNYWADESLIEESLFAPGEPRDSSLAKCVQISTELGDKLGDVNCEASLAYVCEIPQ